MKTPFWQRLKPYQADNRVLTCGLTGFLGRSPKQCWGKENITMGKPTGFLDYERIENGNVPPMERIENFKEFHPKLDEQARRCQAGRCMNCGVPMCGSAIKLAGMVTGCPLHNFIPEWNDALYQGQFDMAAWRLLKTSSFPEFGIYFF